LRMVKLTLKYGLCAASAHGFVAYGILLTRLGDPDGGYHFGKLGPVILEKRYNHIRTEWVPRVFVPFYGIVAPLKEARHSCALEVRDAARVGLVSGDHQFAFLGFCSYSMMCFGTQVRLADVEKITRKNVDLSKMYKQEFFLPTQLLLLEVVLVLSGKLNDPVVVNGVLTSPTASLDTIKQEPSKMAEPIYFLWKMVIAYHFGDFHIALEMADNCRHAQLLLPSISLGSHLVLFDAMSCLAIARIVPKRRKQLLSIVLGRLKQSRKFAKHNPQDGSPALYLIEAELAALDGNKEKAMSSYSLSIASAEAAKFLHIHALAHERAGLALREFGESSLANDHLDQALGIYKAWGAMAKVDHMRSNMD
jgi:hypothetical protein